MGRRSYRRDRKGRFARTGSSGGGKKKKISARKAKRHARYGKSRKTANSRQRRARQDRAEFVGSAAVVVAGLGIAATGMRLEAKANSRHKAQMAKHSAVSNRRAVRSIKANGKAQVAYQKSLTRSALDRGAKGAARKQAIRQARKNGFAS